MSSRLVDAALETAWSQWCALGVSGSGALVPTHAVDLEAAIAFAPLLRELDPRLHQEVLDWCVQFASEFTSVARLKHVIRLFEPAQQDRFEALAAIVNEHGGTKWPTRARPSPFEPTLKSCCRLDRPAAIELRARKIFGINARADVLVGLAMQPSSDKPLWTHVNLILDTGYTKRNLSNTLNDLAAGGLLGTMQFGNTMRYALLHREALREILAPVPSTEWHPWAQVLSLTASLVDAHRRTGASANITRIVELNRILEQGRSRFDRSRLPLPKAAAGDPWPAIEEWLISNLKP